jgi:hypothetical protein
VKNHQSLRLEIAALVSLFSGHQGLRLRAEIFAIAALLGIAFYYLYPPESGQRQA